MNNQAARLVELLKLDKNQIPENGNKIVSICSGKGGTGKSFFAANLAFLLSQKRKKVLLIDFDLNFSNINILLNHTVKKNISNFFYQTESLEELVVNYNENLDLIFGASGENEMPKLSNDLLDYFFAMLNKIAFKYDFIILDSSAGANDFTVKQLLNSNINIVLLSPEPTAVMDAYVVIKLLKENGYSGHKLAVVNKTMSANDANDAFNNLSVASKHFLNEGVEFLGEISFGKEVHQSIINQELLATSDQNSIQIAQISGCADRLIKYAQMANSNHSTHSIAK